MRPPIFSGLFRCSLPVLQVGAGAALVKKRGLVRCLAVCTPLLASICRLTAGPTWLERTRTYPLQLLKPPQLLQQGRGGRKGSCCLRRMGRCIGAPTNKLTAGQTDRGEAGHTQLCDHSPIEVAMALAEASALPP